MAGKKKGLTQAPSQEQIWATIHQQVLTNKAHEAEIKEMAKQKAKALFTPPKVAAPARPRKRK